MVMGDDRILAWLMIDRYFLSKRNCQKKPKRVGMVKAAKLNNVLSLINNEFIKFILY